MKKYRPSLSRGDLDTIVLALYLRENWFGEMQLTSSELREDYLVLAQDDTKNLRKRLQQIVKGEIE